MGRGYGGGVCGAHLLSLLASLRFLSLPPGPPAPAHSGWVRWFLSNLEGVHHHLEGEFGFGVVSGRVLRDLFVVGLTRPLNQS